MVGPTRRYTRLLRNASAFDRPTRYQAASPNSPPKVPARPTASGSMNPMWAATPPRISARSPSTAVPRKTASRPKRVMSASTAPSSLPETCAGVRREHARGSAVRLPHRQRHAIRQALEHDAYRQIEGHLLGAAAHHVSDDARTLRELDHHHDVRQEVLHGGQEWLVRHDVGEHPPSPAGLEPLEAVAALPVERLRRPDGLAGRTIALLHQLARP